MGVDYHIIVNPLAGAGAASTFVEAEVLPLLSARGLSYKVHTTDSGSSGSGSIAKAILAERADGPTRVIVAGGDGTAHELIDGVLASPAPLGRWELIVLPLGTANALHSSLFPPSSASSADEDMLASLHSALAGHAPRRLPVTLTTLSGPDKEPQTSVSHIVQSTSLHANLLHDSEALRSRIPGLERFKAAAKLNIGQFFPARVTLSSPVRQYDPKSKSFVSPFTLEASEAEDGADWGVDDAFSYVLASSTTPRLEPTFVILPTLKHPEDGYLDLLVLRPTRDPRVQATPGSPPPETGESKAEQAKEAEDDPLAKFSARGRVWARRAQEVLTAAYHDGRHVELCYPTTRHAPGESSEDMLHLAQQADGWEAVPASDPRAGAPVAEVFRCKGFTWRPADASGKAGLVCADGSIHRVPQGGEWTVEVMETKEGEGFWVYGP